MYGLKRNTQRLFDNGGMLFLMAMDHAQSGIIDGLQSVEATALAHANTKADGFILNVGMAPIMGQRRELLNKKLALRTSCANTVMTANPTNVHTNNVSPQTALSLGADAVVMMLIMGGNDYSSLQSVARDIDAYHAYQIPVIVEILAADPRQLQTFQVQANGARIAAELGADVVKGFYTDSFDKVINNCPVPFILAGGPIGVDIDAMVSHAVDCGIKGLAFGRNIFQSADSKKTIEHLNSLLKR